MNVPRVKFNWDVNVLSGLNFVMIAAALVASISTYTEKTRDLTDAISANARQDQTLSAIEDVLTELATYGPRISALETTTLSNVSRLNDVEKTAIRTEGQLERVNELMDEQKQRGAVATQDRETMLEGIAEIQDLLRETIPSENDKIMKEFSDR